MLKWWGLLMTNTRMLVLFALLLIGQPIYFFWFELIPLQFAVRLLDFPRGNHGRVDARRYPEMERLGLNRTIVIG